MPGYSPAPLRAPAVRLWKTFRSKPNAIPVDSKNCSPSHRNRCSPSDRNAVRNHNGMVFGFRPESRSPSTGFPSRLRDLQYDSDHHEERQLIAGAQDTLALRCRPLNEARCGRMIVAMIDANHISERLASLKLEISDLRVANARYWSRKEHTALDKSASALRQQRLIQIKLELADMSKRCA
jgi:hypothetical protein